MDDNTKISVTDMRELRAAARRDGIVELGMRVLDREPVLKHVLVSRHARLRETLKGAQLAETLKDDILSHALVMALEQIIALDHGHRRFLVDLLPLDGDGGSLE